MCIRLSTQSSSSTLTGCIQTCAYNNALFKVWVFCRTVPLYLSMGTLAAVSLAGNTLQFLDFAFDTISKSRQIRTFILKERPDLEDLTTDLKDLSSRLQASSGSVDLVLEQLSSRCREVAEELLEALESLRIKGEHTRFQNLRKALKVLWGQEKLRTLEERLAIFRQELILHIVVELRSRYSCFAAHFKIQS